jgi:hypothetical protein
MVYLCPAFEEESIWVHSILNSAANHRQVVKHLRGCSRVLEEYLT